MKSVIKKNIKRLLYSKLSSFVIILGPFLLIVLFGVAYEQNEIYGVNIGFHVEDANEFSQGFIDSMDANGFQIYSFTSVEDCTDAVTQGRTLVCINQKDTHMQFYVDYSRLNLVYIILNVIADELDYNIELFSEATLDNMIKQLRWSVGELQEGVDYIDQLQEQSGSMIQRLEDISTQIDELQITIPQTIDVASLRADLASQQQQLEGLDFSDDISSYKNQIETYQAELVQVSADLNELDGDLQEVKEIVESSENILGCSSDVNLFDLEEAERDDLLNNSATPECLLLSTMTSYFSDTQADINEYNDQIDQISSDLDGVKNDLDTVESDLGGVTSGTSGAFDNANAQIDAFDQGQAALQSEIARVDDLKASFVDDIDGARIALEQSQATVGELNASASGVVELFANISSVRADSIINPLSTEVIPLSGERNTLDLLYSSLILLVTCFTSILISSLLTVRERLSPAAFRNVISPHSDIMRLVAHYVTIMILLLAQSAIFFVVGRLFFGVEFVIVWWQLGLLLVLINSIFVLLGMFIGCLFNSEETTIFTALSLCILLFVFSSVLIPIERMRASLAAIVQFSPFIVSESVLRQALIYGEVLTQWPWLTGLFVYAIVFGGLVYYLGRGKV